MRCAFVFVGLPEAKRAVNNSLALVFEWTSTTTLNIVALRWTLCLFDAWLLVGRWRPRATWDHWIPSLSRSPRSTAASGLSRRMPKPTNLPRSVLHSEMEDDQVVVEVAVAGERICA